MKRQGFHHRKVRRLARELRALGVAQHAEPLARGLLEGLWYVTATEAPRGDVGRMTDEDLADAVGWDGSPGALVHALVEARWLDREEGHRLVVHDWSHHADRHVHRALVRMGAHFVDGTAPRLSEATVAEREAWVAATAERPHGEAAGDTAGTPAVAPEPLFGAPVDPRKADPGSSLSRSQSEEPEPERREGARGAPGAALAAPREPRLARVWSRLLDAAACYLGRRPAWKLDVYRRELQARLREHPERGLELGAQIVHGYRVARAGWDEIEAHFTPKTLLRPKNADEYLTAFDRAVEAGRRPPFRRAPSEPASRATAAASADADRTAARRRRERQEVLDQMAADGEIDAPTEEAYQRAVAKWQREGRPGPWRERADRRAGLRVEPGGRARATR